MSCLPVTVLAKLPLCHAVVGGVGCIWPHRCQDLSVYNMLKVWWRKRPADSDLLGGGGGEDDKAPPLPLVLGFGATSAVCGAVVGYPLTVVRTRLMVQGMATVPLSDGGGCHRAHYAYTGTWDAIVQIAKTEVRILMAHSATHRACGGQLSTSPSCSVIIRKSQTPHMALHRRASVDSSGGKSRACLKQFQPFLPAMESLNSPVRSSTVGKNSISSAQHRLRLQ